MRNSSKTPRSLGASAGIGRSEIAKSQSELHTSIGLIPQEKSMQKASKWPPVLREKHNARYSNHHRKLRTELLIKEPNCRLCARVGKQSVATVADHQTPLCEWPHQAAWGVDALQPLCKPCHAKKTAREGAKARWAQHNALKRLAAFIGAGGRIL